MEEALDDLPKSLEALYADVLTRKIPEDYREEAKVMLMWLAYSYRPLRLREIAVIASLPEQNVLQICTSSFVVLSREMIDGYYHKDVVKFDHFSVKEFLVSERHLASIAPTASSFYIPPMLAHLQIASTCISTLLDPRLVNHIERRVRHEPDLHPDFHKERWRLDTGEDDIHSIIPLLGYSQDWHFHVQDADSMSTRSAQLNDPSLKSESENLRDHIHKLFCDENHLSFRFWAQVHDATDIPIDIPLSPIYYTSYFNLTDNVRRLLEPRSNPREAMGVVFTLRNEPQEQVTPLYIAGVRGNPEIVSLFLDSGMKIAQSDFKYMIENNERDGLTIMTSILEAQPDLSITDDTVIAAARNIYTKDFVKCFLNNGSLSSKARLLLVLSHWHECLEGANTGLMKALVKHGEGIGCTGRDFFNAVIQGSCPRSRYDPESHLESVLEKYEPLSLSQDITECIALDTAGGVDMLRCLCQKYKDISFSQDQLAVAAKKFFHGMILVDIILEYDKNLQISQLVIQAAARNHFGTGVFFALMYHKKSLEITWETLKIIVDIPEPADKCDDGHVGWLDPYHDVGQIVHVLMDHEDCGFRLPDEQQPIMQAYDWMEYHMNHSKDCKVAVSEQMLEAAARWEPDAIDYLQSHARPNVTFRKYALQELSILRRSNTI